MIQTIIKNYQSTYLANTWRQAVRKRVITKNNFQATGDIKKAKTFFSAVISYKPHTHFVSHGEHVVFFCGFKLNGSEEFC